MTAAEIIAEAQSLTRQNIGLTTAQTVAWLNRIQRNYCRKDDWPELKVFGQTLATTANQAYVNLPTDFERFVGKKVLYNPSVITGGYEGGYAIPILPSGSSQQDTVVAGWRQTGTGTPISVSQAGAAGAYKLYLYPLPSLGNITIVYDYFRAPTAILADASNSPDVQALCDTFTMALCCQYCAYDNDDRLSYFRGEERAAYNAAKRNLPIQ